MSKLLLGGIGWVFLLSGSGCMAGRRTKASVYDAYYRYQVGDNSGALKNIQRAVRQAARPCVPGYVVIEAYDDAGLYYFLNDRPREAFIHQAVAVLLAEVIETPPSMRQTYLTRLFRALAASDVALEPPDIRKDLRVLLTVPEVRDNPLILKYYAADRRLPAG